MNSPIVCYQEGDLQCHGQIPETSGDNLGDFIWHWIGQVELKEKAKYCSKIVAKWVIKLKNPA